MQKGISNDIMLISTHFIYVLYRSKSVACQILYRVRLQGVCCNYTLDCQGIYTASAVTKEMPYVYFVQDNIFDYNIILCPINVENTHWTLMVTYLT